MVNVLGEEEKKQVLELGRLGWPLRRIERRTGVRRETVSAYLKAAGISVFGPGRRGRRSKPAILQGVSTESGSEKAAIAEGMEGPDHVSSGAPTAAETVGASPSVLPGTSGAGPPTSPTDPSKPAITEGVSTDFIGASSPNPAASTCEPFRDLIEEALGRGRNAMGIWQDLVDDHSFRAGYSSVRRFVAKLRGTTSPEARVVIRTQIGEEGQVDYGDGPMVRHPASGKYRRTRLFVFTLGYSRKSVRFVVWSSSTRVWAELHERAFRQIGGSVKVIVLDNLREGVLKPDFYDPALNPLYRDVLAHYGSVALPCRVRDPDRKGKVESGVGHAQMTPLKGQRFETLEAAQAYLDRWEERWADTRIHGTTKRQVSEMFAEEKPALRELPVEPFRYYKFGKRTVNLDNCVEVDGAYYGAPPRSIGRELAVQWDGLHVRILEPITEKLLREHLVIRRGHHRIKEEDKPSRTPQTTEALLRRAHNAGTDIGTVCEQIHRIDGEPGVRRILGMLSLAKKYGVARTDDAAKAALEMGAPTYRFVRTYLERQPPLPLTLKQVDPLIRQLNLYRDLIDRKTGEQS